MSVKYREDHDVDLDQLASLFESAGWGSRTKDRVRLSRMVSGAMFVVHAWEGDRLVGFARAISDGVSNAYVTTVAVLPEHQRRGIGREIMRRLMAGKDELTFALHTGNREVQPFYQECGFVSSAQMMRRPRSR